MCIETERDWEQEIDGNLNRQGPLVGEVKDIKTIEDSPYVERS